jgi:hypothetical protein
LLKRDNATDTSWDDVTASATPDTDANTFTLSNQTSFSQYAIGAGEDNSLPITLSFFTATSTAKGVLLAWRTETEVGNIGFFIYRSESQDGSFEKIGWVDGTGNSAMPREYQLIDKTAKKGHTYFYYIEDVDIEGLREKSKIIQIALQKPPAVIPSRTELFQNYPNPFNPESWIPFQLAQNADVVIRIYDVRGRLVKELALGKKAAGIYQNKERAVYWDGKDARNEKVASGVYWYMMEASDENGVRTFMATRKMVLLK